MWLLNTEDVAHTTEELGFSSWFRLTFKLDNIGLKMLPWLGMTLGSDIGLHVPAWEGLWALGVASGCLPRGAHVAPQAVLCIPRGIYVTLRQVPG